MSLRPIRWKKLKLSWLKEDLWLRTSIMLTPYGEGELWREDRTGNNWYGAAEVRGDLPHAHSKLGPYNWGSYDLGSRTTAEEKLVAGLPVDVDGHDVVFRMPDWGWKRSRRHFFITVDGATYEAYPRTFGSIEMMRPNGTLLLRRTAMSDIKIADDATAVEYTITALCFIIDLPTRITRNPFRWL